MKSTLLYGLFLFLGLATMAQAGPLPSAANLVESNAGKHGFVTINPKTQRLMFEDGTPARFYGVCHHSFIETADRKISDQEMITLLDDLKAMGSNVIRFQTHTTAMQKDSLGKSLNPIALDNRDRFFAHAIKRGIYLHMNLHTRGYAQQLAKKAHGSSELICIIDEIIEMNNKFVTDMLNHVNPHTGRAYKDEPAIISLQLGNEHHTYSRLGWRNMYEKHTGPYKDEIQRKFNAFLLEKYVTRAKLATAWGDLLKQNEDPANGTVLANLTQATQAEVDIAVSAARKAQPKWAKLTGHERARYLYAIARLLQKHSRLFAVLETLDNGKPIREARDVDIPLAQRHFYYHAGMAQLMEGELPDAQALGVCGQIIPWNFPLLMLAWKVAPALAMGNTVVLKPAEYTSLTALMFADICQQAGLPKGVVNIVTGDGAVGQMIVNADVDKIAFTGSTAVGRRIREETAGSGKALTLELGGKSPYIVFDDADLDSAVEGLVDAIWFNQGQVCCAGSRLLVHEPVADRFYAKLRARMGKLRVGNPLDKSIDVGALVDPVQVQRVTDMVASNSAGDMFTAGDIPDSGCFYPPTLITGLHPADTLMQEEIFGPVLVATTFRTPDEAVAIDALADGIDLTPLFDLLADETVLKVFHAARQDVEIFVNLAGKVPTPIFDTQIAAMVCGYGDSVGYERLVRDIAKKSIDKTMRFTDWSRRPLGDKQIEYALGDVTHLRKIYSKLAERLEANDRTSWLDDEMAILTDTATYLVDPKNA